MSEAMQEAMNLIDFLSLASQQRKHGVDTCLTMIQTLQSHLLASTPEQNEPALIEDINRIVGILRMKG